MTAQALKNMNSGVLVASRRRQLHMAFWIVTTICYFLNANLLDENLQYALHLKSFFLPIQMATGYVLVLVFLKKGIYKGRYVLSLSGFVVFAYLICVLANLFHDYYFVGLKPDWFDAPPIIKMLVNFRGLIAYYFVWIFFLPLLLCCLEVIYRQFNNFEQLELLEIEKRQAELNLLKTQIHPTFLLSTLRNLQQLTKVSDPAAPIVVEKLSTTLDYILYRGPQEQIELSEELNAIEEYIVLERIRLQNELEIDLQINVSNHSQSMAPLILFSFLEHNFKNQTIVKVQLKNSWIAIEEKGDEILAEIKNEIREGQGNGFKYDLINMEKQLQISYPGRYILEESKEGKDHLLILRITL